MNALQYVIDLSLEQHPHGTNAAFVGCRATFFVHGVSLAVQIEGGELRRVDHISYRDSAGVARELIATLRSTRASDDPGTPHSQKDLLDVVRRETLGCSNIAPCHRPLVTAPRQVQRADQAILCPRRNSHVFTIDTAAGADKRTNARPVFGVAKRAAAAVPTGEAHRPAPE